MLMLKSVRNKCKIYYNVKNEKPMNFINKNFQNFQNSGVSSLNSIPLFEIGDLSFDVSYQINTKLLATMVKFLIYHFLLFS